MVLAASSWYRSRFIASGVPSHRVEVTGVPRYDAIPRIRRLWLARRHTTGSPQPPRVLLLSQPFVRYKELSEADYHPLAAIARGALAEVANRDGATVEVRMHPQRPQTGHGCSGWRPAAGDIGGAGQATRRHVGFMRCRCWLHLQRSARGDGRRCSRCGHRDATDRTGHSVLQGCGCACRHGCRYRRATDRSRRGQQGISELPSKVIDEMGVLDGMASDRVARQCGRLLAGSRPGASWKSPWWHL